MRIHSILEADALNFNVLRHAQIIADFIFPQNVLNKNHD
jgi:hypothetical protein